MNENVEKTVLSVQSRICQHNTIMMGMCTAARGCSISTVTNCAKDNSTTKYVFTGLEES